MNPRQPSLRTAPRPPQPDPRPQQVYRLAAGAVLAGALALRLWALGGGGPAYDPALLAASPYRASYHLDEDNILWGPVQMRPPQGNFDVHDYHWGTLQFYLVEGALLGAEAGGAGLITLGQLALLGGPHPVDALRAWLGAHLQPGQAVARLWPEYPVLDESRYRLVRLDPWRPDLPRGARPDYVILDDMALGPATPALRTALAADYRPVAQFSARPHLGPFAWDEGPTPHDWKYSHPTFVVYARR